jgi:hypothetical protein
VRTIAVAGALANRPGNGGGASVRMTWVRALARLGFDVWFLEQVERRSLRAADGSPAPPQRSTGVRFFREVVRRHGFEERSALLDERGGVLAGRERSAVDEMAERAELLVNLGGHLDWPDLFERFRRRVYLDLDPGHTQLWHAEGAGAARLRGHDRYFTVGLNVGAPGWPLPANGIDWRPLPPPVVLGEWAEDTPAGESREEMGPFTTVSSWRGPFGRPSHGGRTFGLKAHEFRRFLDLPRRAPGEFEIALDIDEADRADREALVAHGWRIADPKREACDPESYRRYIRASGAEFSVAQGIYVETGSGWISDRTARYLAAGRPALVQDTGVGSALPVGLGLLVFRDLEQAVAGAAEIARDYARHSDGARRLAREAFDSDRVARRMLEQADIALEAA